MRFQGKITTENNDLFDWISDNREKATIELNDSNFEHDTQGEQYVDYINIGYLASVNDRFFIL